MRFNETVLATGTGFVAVGATGPLLITNRHNLSGRSSETGKTISPTGGVPDRVVISHNRKNALGHSVLRTEPLIGAEGRELWLEHPTLGSRADVVALPLTQLDDVEIIPHSIGVGDPQIRIGPADTVSVVGFPFGLRTAGTLAIWATGFVASEPEIDHDGLPVFLVDCRARKGQSGSAVIAHRGGGTLAMVDGSSVVFSGPVTRFLGIYSGRINEESDLGIVWKSEAILQVMNGIRAGTTLGRTLSTSMAILKLSSA